MREKGEKKGERRVKLVMRSKHSAALGCNTVLINMFWLNGGRSCQALFPNSNYYQINHLMKYR